MPTRKPGQFITQIKRYAIKPLPRPNPSTTLETTLLLKEDFRLQTRARQQHSFSSRRHAAVVCSVRPNDMHGRNVCMRAPPPPVVLCVVKPRLGARGAPPSRVNASAVPCFPEESFVFSVLSCSLQTTTRHHACSYKYGPATSSRRAVRCRTKT